MRMKRDGHCCVDGCQKPIHGRGYCLAHYKRLIKSGDPLGSGIAMKGAPLEFVQFAARDDGEGCLLWPFPPTAYGYGQLNYHGEVMHAHRAVLIEAGYEPPNGSLSVSAHKPVVCHNPLCVRLAHLRWDDAAGNSADRMLDGTVPLGSKHHNAKLKEADIPAIRRLAKTHTRQEIADQFGVSATAITHVVLRTTWKWLD